LTEGSALIKEKHPGGRPSKLTPELTSRLCNLLEKGVSYKTACELSGVAYVTFNEWIKEAEENIDCDPKFVEFSYRIRQAESKCIERALDTVNGAIDDGNVAAAMWLLERRLRKDFARSELIDLKNQHSGGVTLNLTRTSCRKEDVQSSE
jgi:hypothetical protein